LFANVLRPILYAVLGITPWEGALPALLATTSPEAKGWSGRYVSGALPRTGIKPLAEDEALAELLWTTSMQLTGALDVPAGRSGQKAAHAQTTEGQAKQGL
jgi:hypothetical protein